MSFLNWLLRKKYEQRLVFDCQRKRENNQAKPEHNPMWSCTETLETRKLETNSYSTEVRIFEISTAQLNEIVNPTGK